MKIKRNIRRYYPHLISSQKADKDPKQSSSNTNKTARLCQKCVTINAEPCASYVYSIVKYNIQSSDIIWYHCQKPCCVFGFCARRFATELHVS